MPPAAAGLLVHGDAPPSVSPQQLLLAGSTCHTLTQYRQACGGMALPEREAILRVPRALDEASCARLRQVVDECGGVAIDTVDGLPNRGMLCPLPCPRTLDAP